jgi:hypothetical protein
MQHTECCGCIIGCSRRRKSYATNHLHPHLHSLNLARGTNAGANVKNDDERGRRVEVMVGDEYTKTKYGK